MVQKRVFFILWDSIGHSNQEIGGSVNNKSVCYNLAYFDIKINQWTNIKNNKQKQFSYSTKKGGN